MISSSRENDPIIDGPPCALPFCFRLRLHSLDNYEFRVSRGLAQRLWLGVFWRGPPLSRLLHAGKLGDDYAKRANIDSDVYSEIFATSAMREVWSDRSRIQYYLDFEKALALTQAHLGVIPK